MGLIIAPTVIVVLDDSIDTSIFSSLTEEEENGKAKKLLSPFSLQSNEFTSNLELKNFEHFGYYFKNYPKPHLNLISPPPDYNII
ncbi:hypothetical protein [Thalassobellus suaedae]|nr:hypothetical protein RHP51_17210 [Flavobacteriaceae bacterium HL-DH14]